MKKYGIDIDKLPVSKKITDPVIILKLDMMARFIEHTLHMSSAEIIKKTGLDKSDLSRLRVQYYERFTIDRLVRIMDSLGMEFQVVASNKK